MRPIVKHILIIFLFLLCAGVQAQKVYFNGLGRALVTNEALNGNILHNDTATANRGTDGYALFDMGVNIQPYDYLRGKAIIRLKNRFGVFFGQGASVEFRQVLLEGLISKKVRYALGDIDVMLTPYTVYNNPEYYSPYESDIFGLRRSIVYYENFNVGNNWRVQGLKADGKLRFGNSFRLRLNTFFTRTRPTNYYNAPDRLLMGGSALGSFGKSVALGVHLTHFFDLPGEAGSGSFKNDVFTTSLKLSEYAGSTLLQLKGEAGGSWYQKFLTQDSGKSQNDFFYDVHGEAGLRPLNITLYAGYKQVGMHFYSAAAQTLRIDVTRAPALFPTVQNNLEVRGQLLYDRFTQENVYNQTIRPVLMPFLPQYGNVLPYGAATPNRKGFYMCATAGSKERVLQASLQGNMLSEVQGEGTAARRKFILIQGGFSMQLHKLLKTERMLVLSGGIRAEDTKRPDSLAVSLSSQQLDAGISIETIKNLDIMIGYKGLNSKGNEYISQRNVFNEAVQFTPVTLNMRQQILALGVRYRFSEKSYFSFTANYTSIEQPDRPEMNYRINQYFVVYTVQF